MGTNFSYHLVFKREQWVDVLKTITEHAGPSPMGPVELELPSGEQVSLPFRAGFSFGAYAGQSADRVAEELNKGGIADEFRAGCRNKGFPLLGKVSVTTRSDIEWVIFSNKQKFIIRKRNDVFDVIVLKTLVCDKTTKQLANLGLTLKVKEDKVIRDYLAPYSRTKVARQVSPDWVAIETIDLSVYLHSFIEYDEPKPFFVRSPGSLLAEGVVDFEFWAPFSIISSLFSQSQTIRGLFVEICEKHHGLCGLLDTQGEEHDVFWLEGQRVDPPMKMTGEQISARLQAML